MKNIFIVLLVILSSFAYGQGERILSFDVEVLVDKEADLVVTETIRVNARNQQIKRGITRSLPLQRRDVDGNLVGMRYDVLSVTKDGLRENHFVKKEGNDKVIYIGNRDIILRPNVYTYVIKYKTYNQIGFFENHDELYWNVTGNDWAFPIDNVSARVTFPYGTTVNGVKCYSGRRGSKSQDCSASKNPLVYTAQKLRAGEGLTIVSAIDKGIINMPPPPAPPTFLERFGFLFLAIFGGLVLGGYYIFTWLKHGVDPAKPAVYPIFESPEGLSPAGVGSIHNDKVSYDYISASIINLAVKGYLKIEDESSKGLFTKRQAYRLKKLRSIGNNEPQEEQKLFNRLFRSYNEILIDGDYDPDVEAALLEYQFAVKNEFKDLIEEGRNYKFLMFPILLMVGILGVSAATHLFELPDVLGQLFSGGLVFTIFAVVFFLPIVGNLIRRTSWAKWVLPILIIALLIGLIVALPNAQMNTYVFIGFLIFGIVSFFLYKYLIERPSEEKLRLQSLIEGFKMYMVAAENNQIQHFNPPSMTPEIFEKLLPYAIALKADKVWGEKFQKYLSAAAISNYQSGWYGGHYYNPYMFSDMSETMRRTVNQSAVEPAPEGGFEGGGSNWGSGMGGGGFSGGGGGGGGGGGW